MHPGNGVFGFDVAFSHVAEPTPEQTTAKGTYPIYEEHAFHVIVLVLNDAGQHTSEPGFYGAKVSIEIPDTHQLRSRDVLPYVRNTQAAFLELGGLSLALQQLRIDEHHRLIRNVFALCLQLLHKRAQIDHKKSIGSSHLGCCKTDTLSTMHGLYHIVD